LQPNNTLNCIISRGVNLDEAFIKESIDKFGNIILKAAFSITGNLSDAEDVFSDVFFCLWQKQKIFDSDQHQKAWLIRVAINKAKNIKKQAFNRYRAELDEDIIFIKEDDENRWIRDALNQLRPKDRVIVYLHYYQGYGYKEIGKMLKIGESGVKSRVMRAREKLKGMLRD